MCKYVNNNSTNISPPSDLSTANAFLTEWWEIIYTLNTILLQSKYEPAYPHLWIFHCKSKPCLVELFYISFISFKECGSAHLKVSQWILCVSLWLSLSRLYICSVLWLSSVTTTLSLPSRNCARYERNVHENVHEVIYLQKNSKHN